jgi:hypothetical protein
MGARFLSAPLALDSAYNPRCANRRSLKLPSARPRIGSMNGRASTDPPGTTKPARSRYTPDSDASRPSVHTRHLHIGQRSTGQRRKRSGIVGSLYGSGWRENLAGVRQEELRAPIEPDRVAPTRPRTRGSVRSEARVSRVRTIALALGRPPSGRVLRRRSARPGEVLHAGRPLFHGTGPASISCAARRASSSA